MSARAWPAAVAACVGVGLCVVAGAGLHQRSRTVTTVLTRTAPPDVAPAATGAGASAYDCPGVGACASVAVPRAFLAAVRAAFPSASVLDATAVAGTVSGAAPAATILRSSVYLQDTGGRLIGVVSRCVPSGAAVTARDGGVGASSGPAQLVIVRGGAPGCSVVVTVDVPVGSTSPVAAAVGLADDPALRLSVP